MPTTKSRDGQSAQSHRAPNKDLVSKQENEVQKGSEIQGNNALSLRTLSGQKPAAKWAQSRWIFWSASKCKQPEL